MSTQELAERILGIIKNADDAADQHAAYALALDEIETLCKEQLTGEDKA